MTMAYATTHMPRPANTTADAMQAGVRRMVRVGLLVLGGLIMAVGAVLALLPGHLGVPILVVGLMVVLRNSLPARKEFIRLQRRHPNWVFPLRRLMRREPEVIPVVWQQVLRTERMVLPARYRFVRSLRVRYLRRQNIRHRL
jgi:hypothetical protein